MEGQALCDALATNRNFSDLAKECAGGAAAEPDLPRKISLLLNVAWCYEHSALKRRALKVYDEVIALDGKCLVALVRRGKLQHALGKREAAVADWTEVKQLATLSGDFELLADVHSLLHFGLKPKVEPVPAGPATPPAEESPLQNGHARPAAAKQTAPKKAGPAASRIDSKVPASLAKYDFLEPGLQQAQRRARAARYLQLPEVMLHNLEGLGETAIQYVNAGELDKAVAVCSYVLSMAGPEQMMAKIYSYLTRGSAWAMLSTVPGEDREAKLAEAIEDFTKGIAISPVPDLYKRRGQSHMAVEHIEEALQDFEEALKKTINKSEKADILKELGNIYQKLRDFRRARAKLEEAVKLCQDSAQAWNHLALCRTAVGDLAGAVEAGQRAVKLDPAFQEAWLNIGQASKEKADPGVARKALFKAMEGPDVKMKIAAMKLLAQMTHGCGDHLKAANILADALEVDNISPAQKVECCYMRAVCFHGLGYHARAMQVYQETTSVHLTEQIAGSEVAMLQFLAVYQMHMARYTQAMLDVPVHEFCYDRDLSAEVKEAWCKKAPPSVALIEGLAPKEPPRRPGPAPDPSKVEALREEAAAIGKLVQYRHQGFLPNKRQQMMTGFAVIEGAQFVRHLVAESRAGRTVMSVKGSSADPKPHAVSWRDFADIAVKWRQLSEPNDQVVWVDLLSEREFKNGFGSHTPIFSGQTECVRYYMNFNRAFRLFKEQVLKDGFAYDAKNARIPLAGDSKKEEVAKAEHAWHLYREINVDCWVLLHIRSSARPPVLMEGTRLTLVRVPDQPESVEFSIRTPVTPDRWKDFDEELTQLWNNMIKAMVDNDKPAAAKAILTYAFFWYNFMPLARGTAVVGYITILSMFMAAGMPVTAAIPKGTQTDWEAILAPSADDFIAAVSPWLYPAAARGAGDSDQADPLASLPALGDVLITPRHRLEALNEPNLEPI